MPPGFVVVGVEARRGVAAPPAAAESVETDEEGDGARAGDGGGRGIVRERDGVLLGVEDADILNNYLRTVGRGWKKR